MFTLTDEQVEKIIEESLPEFKQAVISDLKQKINWDVQNHVNNIVTQTITEFITAEIVPEIKDALVASKDGIVSGAVKAAPLIAEQLTLSMAGAFKEKMEKSWDRSKILKSMFD